MCIRHSATVRLGLAYLMLLSHFRVSILKLFYECQTFLKEHHHFWNHILGYKLEQTYEQRETISTKAVMKGSSLGNLTSLVML